MKTIIILIGLIFQLLGCICVGYTPLFCEDKEMQKMIGMTGVAFVFLGIGAIAAAAIL